MRRRRDRKQKPWVADYRDASGRRHRLSAPTKEAAALLLAEKLKERGAAQPTAENRDITFSEYADGWLQRIGPQVSRGSVKVYRWAVSLHLEPAFGNLKLREITRVHVKWLVNEKLQSLSKATVRSIRSTLSNLLAEALDDGVVEVNAAMAAGRRKAETPSAIERDARIRPFSDAEVPRLVAGGLDHAERALLLLLLRTGLRPGEAMALRWSDFNFTEREILVERQFYKGHLGPPKTRRARRVDMSKDLADAMTALYVQREREKLEGGRAEIPEWAFCRRDGHPLTESDIRLCFERALRRAGLSGHSAYDCRHTFATTLLARGGAPITYVASQLGHRKPTTTLAFYSHWIPTKDRRYVDALDERCPAQNGTTLGTTREKAPARYREYADSRLSRSSSRAG